MIEEEGPENRNRPGPPNSECHTAVVSGLCLTSGVAFESGSLTPYFSFGPEQVHIWTYDENEESRLVTQVPPDRAPPGKVWKTLVSCLEIALALDCCCEHVYELSYLWMYRFNPKMPIRDQEFHGHSPADDPLLTLKLGRGLVENLYDLADLADLLELLWRDDRFFVAVQQFLVSIRNHWFCIFCEVGADPRMHHPSHEPEAWEAIQVYPALDVALVQACRSAETLVGQPGKNTRRVVERWKSTLTLDPAATFYRVGRRNVDYFQKMYGERRLAAHGRGRVPFDVVRRQVIDAQCFAWQLLVNYIDTHAADCESAKNALGFNARLLHLQAYGVMTNDPRYLASRVKWASE